MSKELVTPPACTGCAKVLRHPRDGYVCPLHAPRGLDPDIRATVSLLVAAGFATTDSGDGHSKPDVGRVFDVPHVMARVEVPKMLAEADRLRSILETIGLSVHPSGGDDPAIEASYDVGAGVAIIMLFNVDDKLLRGGGV